VTNLALSLTALHEKMHLPQAIGMTDFAKAVRPVRRSSAMAWISADRSRVFAAIAAGSLLLCFALLVALPYTFAPLALIVVLLALVSASSGLVGGLTWWAESRGQADGTQLWDQDDAADDPASFLIGFKSTDDGSELGV
jgi:hypothetical protein